MSASMAGLPRLGSVNPALATEGDELVFAGENLATAFSATGIDRRGILVDFPILESSAGSVTVEAPSLPSDWRSGYFVPFFVETGAGAAFTLPPEVSLIEGFVSSDHLYFGAFRVTSGSALSVTGGGLGAILYVEEGASVSVEGSVSRLVIVAENGSTVSFSEYVHRGFLLAGEGALIDGIEQVGSGARIVPAVTAGTPGSQPRIFPRPDFDLPEEDQATLGRSYHRMVSAQISGPASLEWDVTGLPPGVGFTGSHDGLALSGIPQEAGDFEVEVTAWIDHGEFVTSRVKTMTLTVTDDGLPIILNGGVLEVGGGETMDFQILANGSPTSYGAAGLPPGVNIDPATGRITGALMEPGAYLVTLSATNENGTGEGSLMILVDMAPLSISGFLPLTSVPGDTVTIAGGGFSGATEVFFSGGVGLNHLRDAAFTVVSDGEISVVVPDVRTRPQMEFFRSHVVVVTENGATVTHWEDDEFGFPTSWSLLVVNGGETYDSNTSAARAVYLRSGSTGILRTPRTLVLVENGASLEVDPESFGSLIVAAANATVTGEFSDYPDPPDSPMQGNRLIVVPDVGLSPVEELLAVFPLPRILGIFPEYFIAGSTGLPLSETLDVISDFDFGPLVYGAENLPPGLSVSGTDSRLTISGVPGYGGTFESTLLVSNQFGTLRQKVLFVIDDEAMPKFQAIGQQQVAVGEWFNIQVQAFNAPELFDVEDLSAGLSFNPFSGEIFGSLAAAGLYSFTVIAANPHGEDRLTVQIRAGENPLNITRVPEAALEGSWIDVEGTGFTEVTGVYAIDPWRNRIRQVEFEVIDDSRLTLLVPDNFHRFRERGVHLVLVTPDGAVVTISPDFHETTGISGGVFEGDNMVRAGGRLEGESGGLVAYVETGGEIVAGSGSYLVFAENGAGVHFPTSSPHALIHATGAIITGEAPFQRLEVPSLRHALVEPMIVQEVPRITSASEAGGYLGLPFSFQVTTAFSDGSGALVFSADDLPDGLAIDGGSGLIFGRPRAAGVFSTWIEVANENGATAALWRLTVKDPFEEWRETNFAHLPGGKFNPLAAPGAEPFGDGFNNLGKYGFVLDPTGPAHGAEVTGVWREPSGGAAPLFMGYAAESGFSPAAGMTEEVLFSYRRIRADGIGDAVSGYRIGRIRYIAEVSSNLVDWVTGAGHLEQIGAPHDNGDGSETVILRPRNAGAPALFFRVRVIEQ